VSDFLLWLRESLPWLGPGFVYCVHEDGLDDLDRDLRRAGFAVMTLRGEDITDAQSFHAAAKRAFIFPDYYGHNWDAFDECIGEVKFTHPTAIVSTAADRLAASNLKTFAEAVVQLIRVRDALATPTPESSAAPAPPRRGRAPTAQTDAAVRDQAGLVGPAEIGGSPSTCAPCQTLPAQRSSRG